MEKLFVVTAPGLEPFTAQELRQLGLLPTTQTKPERQETPLADPDQAGGIEFSGDLEAIYLANLHLRTASRVLLRFGDFHAAAFSELKRHTNRLPWERFLNPGMGVAIRVTCHKSRLYHAAAVAREITATIGDRLGKKVELQKFDENSPDPLPQLIVVRLVDDHCTISIDSSGELLHRRGYRLETAKAPLRETLAAGLLLASGWDTISPLIDPFCGSGTIPIEAALLARNIPPGFNRRFAFMNWPGFRVDEWNKLLKVSQETQKEKTSPLLGSDRDAGAIRIAKANADRAGVAQDVEFSHCAVSAIEPAGTGWVVTNPPYGLRVSANKDLRNLYAQFGKVLRLKCPGWKITVMCSDLVLLHQMDLHLETQLTLVNGGVSVWVGQGVVQ
jgi:putative N6-adenine-specific DNA methylase